MTYPQQPRQPSGWQPPQAWQQPYYPQHVAVTRKGLRGTSHLMHLILTVVTGGLWLPVWIILSLRGRDEVTRYQ
ncbi:MAG TPA: hypothetical protein VF506_18430 [Streptosporangiaceae bacterium]